MHKCTSYQQVFHALFLQSAQVIRGCK